MIMMMKQNESSKKHPLLPVPQLHRGLWELGVEKKMEAVEKIQCHPLPRRPHLQAQQPPVPDQDRLNQGEAPAEAQVKRLLVMKRLLYFMEQTQY